MGVSNFLAFLGLIETALLLHQTYLALKYISLPLAVVCFILGAFFIILNILGFTMLGLLLKGKLNEPRR